MQIGDDFDPKFDEVNIDSIQYNENPVVPIAAIADSSFIEIALEEDFHPGDTVTVVYEVTIPENAGSGDTFEFSGFAALDDTGEIDHTNDADISINLSLTASAGVNQTIDEEKAVELNATGSIGPDGDSLSYTWTQTAGPSVSLSNVTSPTPSFTAPSVGTTTTLTFVVEVVDGNGGTDTDTVNVTVRPVVDPIDGFENAPTDPDDDGKFEDVNGDSDVNVGDVQALFANSQDPVIQDNVVAFDFNDDGNVNVGDVQTLFAKGVAA